MKDNESRERATTVGKMKIIFISGPYRSNCEWQLEEFLRHAEDVSLRLWKEGWAVICPHKNTAHFEGGLGIPDSTWLAGDIEILKRCDAVYMMAGWEKSTGSMAELKISKECGIEVIYEL